MNPHHYIITIHNGEKILREVMSGVIKNAGEKSIIVPVLDGCSDNSESIVMEFAQKNANIRPIYSPDLHEIGAINEGLAVLPEGNVFILQDDVILTSDKIQKYFEETLLRKYPNAGYVTMRMGGAIVRTTRMKAFFQFFTSRFQVRGRMVDVDRLIHSTFDKHTSKLDGKIDAWDIIEIEAGIKSPVWVSAKLRENLKYLDRNLMPYCYDDVDWSIGSRKLGLVNLLAAVPYVSDKEWGGTRKAGNTFSAQCSPVIYRNRRYLFEKHRAWLIKNGNSGRDGII